MNERLFSYKKVVIPPLILSPPQDGPNENAKPFQNIRDDLTDLEGEVIAALLDIGVLQAQLADMGEEGASGSCACWPDGFALFDDLFFDIHSMSVAYYKFSEDSFITQVSANDSAGQRAFARYDDIRAYCMYKPFEGYRIERYTPTPQPDCGLELWSAAVDVAQSNTIPHIYTRCYDCTDPNGYCRYDATVCQF